MNIRTPSQWEHARQEIGLTTEGATWVANRVRVESWYAVGDMADNASDVSSAWDVVQDVIYKVFHDLA